jgi:hypothetical protein
VDYGGKRSNNNIRKAIVTTNSDVINLACRYAAAPDLAFPVKVFAQEADARVWLTAEIRPNLGLVHLTDTSSVWKPPEARISEGILCTIILPLH